MSIFITVGLSIFLAGAGLAQTKISVQPDNGTAVYRAGETATWNVYLEKDGRSFDGPVAYTVKKGGLKVVDRGTLVLKDGKASVSASRSDPGALLMQLQLDDMGFEIDDRLRRQAGGGAIFDYGKIRPSAEEPADFDAFWQSKLAELAAVPMNVRLEQVDNSEVDLWKISMDNIRGTKIYGHIAKPKNAKGKLPAVANFDAAGVRAADPNKVVQDARKGWLSIHIIAHSIDAYREPAFYEALSNGELKDYTAVGREDRETSYFLRMLLGTVRCVDYLSERDDWDGKVLRVNGGSQGGWQSIAAAALSPKVTLLTANVPAGCDHTGRLADRDCGWPKAFWNNEKALEVSKYYDNVFFARRINCPAIIAVGAIDPVCPPEGVCAMFNQLAGPKRLVVLVTGAHNGIGNQPIRDLLDGLDGAMRSGEPLPGLE
jgi:cephalosporin-C deacetylase-like acetyl esterase